MISYPRPRHRISDSPDKAEGQAVVELTFAFVLFFTMFMAVVEFSHLLYTKLTLQHALRSAGRYMVTGRTGQDSEGKNIPRDQMIHDVFCANIIATGVQCPHLGSNFEFVCLGSACTAPGGGPEQVVMVTVTLSKPPLIPFGSQFLPAGGFPFQLSTTWKNEPFPLS
jgi:TadE-like protein